MAEVVTMKVYGIENAVARLRDIDRKARRRVVAAGLRAGTKILLREVKNRVPVKTGGLRASVRVQSLKFDRTTGTVTAAVGIGQKSASMKKKSLTAFYAHMVTGGTKPHTIGPKNAKALRIGDRYVASVSHPGSSPNPFMEQAMETGANAAIEAFTKTFGTKLLAELPDEHGS